MSNSFDAIQAPAWNEPIRIGNGPFAHVALFTPKDQRYAPIAAKIFHMNNESLTNEATQCHYEKKLLRQLNHNNIVKCIEGPLELLNLYPESSIMFMQYCNGGSLRSLIEKSDNAFGAPQSIVMDFLSHISEGINYLHSRQIIHRNIKPENILLHHLGQNEIVYKLADFGYAHQFSVLSNFKTFIGTFQYLSPEMIHNTENHNRISGKTSLPNSTVDLWALGVTAFEVITCSRPFLRDVSGLEWARHIEAKRKDEIHIYTDESNQLVYSNIIPRPHRLSRILCDLLTAWLKLLLDANPETRGGRDPGMQKNFWYSNMLSIQNVCVLNFVLLHKWLITPIQCSQEDDRESILQLFMKYIGNPNEFLLLREDGKSLNQLTPDETCCIHRNEGSMYILPKHPNKKHKSLEFHLSPEITDILSEGFVSMNMQKLVRQLKRVLSFFLQLLSEYDSFFRGGVAITNFIKVCINNIKGYIKEFACQRSSLDAIGVFIPDSVIDSTLYKLIRISQMPQHRKTSDRIVLVVKKWEQLKQVYLTTIPEVKASQDLCQDAEAHVREVEYLLDSYPCQVYIAELEGRRVAIQALVSMTVEMIEKVGYTNGVKIGKIIAEEISFFQNKQMQIDTMFSAISRLPSTLMDYENDLHRACMLMSNEFISGVSSKATQAIEELSSLTEANYVIFDPGDPKRTF